MNPKVSVIIPVYNVEKYLRQALDSVVNQTFENIEIICIDNKSQDNTLSILREYSDKDKRFKIIENNENIKQGLARNLGVNIAKGEYIAFLDGDDWYEKTFVEKMYSKAVGTDSDIVICCWEPFDNNTNKIIKNHVYSKLKQIPEEYDNKVFNWRDIKDSIFWQSSVPWDKMYKRSFLIEKDVKFPGEIFFEDNVFVYDAFFKSEKISILRENLIFYRSNRKDAVTNRKDKTFFDYLTIFNLIEDNLKKESLYEEMKYKFLDYKIITLYWWYNRVHFVYKKEFFNKIKADFKKIEIKEDDKKFIRNRTLFLLDRFIKIPFFIYMFIFYFDKIFRVEKGSEYNVVVYFATFEKWYKKNN